MTFTETTPTELRSRGGLLLRNRSLWILVFCIGLLALLSAITAGANSVPYDPESTEPDGTKALMLLLDKLGSEVSIGTEVRGPTVLLFRDDLTRKQREEVEKWVEDGGSLVVADPTSSLVKSAPEDFSVFQPRTLRPSCRSNVVEDVATIRPKSDATYAGLSDTGAATERCFPVDEGVFLELEQRGQGTVATLATGSIFTNRELGKADNSVLVANLLGARDGGAVTVLEGADLTAAGDRTLVQLIPEYLKKGFWQLVVASFVLLAWRSRRFGRPVEESLPVEVPASALVVAVGNLLQTAGQSDAAARLLRADARRRIASLVGLHAGTDARTLARVAAARTGVSERRLLDAMFDVPSSDGQDVLSLAQSTESVRREVSNAR